MKRFINHHRPGQEPVFWTSEMAQWFQALATKTDEQEFSIQDLHGRGKNWRLKFVFWPPQRHTLWQTFSPKQTRK